MTVEIGFLEYFLVPRQPLLALHPDGERGAGQEESVGIFLMIIIILGVNIHHNTYLGQLFTASLTVGRGV